MNIKHMAAALCLYALAACREQGRTGPASPINQNALKALGSMVPNTDYGKDHWQKQFDADTPEWKEAKRLCTETTLADYPNCLPVKDVIQEAQRKRATAGQKIAAKIEEMGRQGYDYDRVRKAWVPIQQMLAAGCTPPVQSGTNTWQCPPGSMIPKGIPDEKFGAEEERLSR